MMQVESPPDSTSTDLEALARRVRTVQRKRLLATATAVAVTMLLIVVVEAALVSVIGARFPWVRVVFGLSIVAGWKVRTLLWPKDPTS